MSEQTLKKFIPIHKRRWFFPATILVIVYAICSIFFLPTVTNAFTQLTMSPASYYQKVEKTNLDQQIDKFSKNYGEYLKAYQNQIKNGAGSNMNLSAKIDSSIATQAGLKGLESIQLSMNSMVKDLKSKSVLTILCNKKELTNFSFLTDMNAQEGYYLIPDLNKAYLKMTYANLYKDEPNLNPTNFYRLLEKKVLSEKLLHSLSTKYLHLVVDQLDEVTETKADKVTADGITQSYTKLTVSVNEKQSLEISKTILTKAQSDKDLENLFIKLGLFTKSEYQDVIKSELKQINTELKNIANTKNNQQNNFIMHVWVNHKGNIIGREFVADSTKIGYQKVVEGTKMGVNAWISENSIDTVRINGTLTLKTAGISGDIHINSKLTDVEPFQITLSMKNAKYKYKDGYSSINGDFTFSSKNNSAIKVLVKTSGTGKKQTISADIMQGTVSLATIQLDSAVIPYQKFNMPSKSAKVYHLETEMDSYLESSDLTGFLKKINEKIEIDGINQILDSMIVSSTY